MSTQNNSQQTTTPQADVQPNSEAGLEDSLNPIFKAIADLQEAVKDLATAVTSGAEVNEGLEETLATKSAEVDELKKDIAELKKFAVGFTHAASENKASDRFGAIGTPSKSESAKDTVQAEGVSLREAGHEMLDKEFKKAVSTFDVPRPAVEVGTKLQNENERAEDLIKEVLKGNVKAMDAGKRAYNIATGGS